MLEGTINAFNVNSLREVVNKRTCPECGGVMHELDRRDENDTSFVWFKCTSDNCNGQWLQRYPRPDYKIDLNQSVA